MPARGRLDFLARASRPRETQFLTLVVVAPPWGGRAAGRATPAPPASSGNNSPKKGRPIGRPPAKTCSPPLRTNLSNPMHLSIRCSPCLCRPTACHQLAKSWWVTIHFPTPFRNSSTLRTYTSAKSATGRRFSIRSIASSRVQPIELKSANAIIGARWTPAAQ
jgi:hypothetical protein